MTLEGSWLSQDMRKLTKDLSSVVLLSKKAMGMQTQYNEAVEHAAPVGDA